MFAVIVKSSAPAISKSIWSSVGEEIVVFPLASKIIASAVPLVSKVVPVVVPVITKLSAIVVSEVVWPIVSAIPDVSVAIFKAPVLFVI